MCCLIKYQNHVCKLQIYTFTVKHPNEDIYLAAGIVGKCNISLQHFAGALFRPGFHSAHEAVSGLSDGAAAHLALVGAIQASDHDYRSPTDNTRWIVLPGHTANPGQQISFIIYFMSWLYATSNRLYLLTTCRFTLH